MIYGVSIYLFGILHSLSGYCLTRGIDELLNFVTGVEQRSSLSSSRVAWKISFNIQLFRYPLSRIYFVLPLSVVHLEQSAFSDKLLIPTLQLSFDI